MVNSNVTAVSFSLGMECNDHFVPLSSFVETFKLDSNPLYPSVLKKSLKATRAQLRPNSISKSVGNLNWEKAYKAPTKRGEGGFR
jgi:hypothetical protein